MKITNIVLKNWRNFKHVSVPLSEFTYIVGPNSCGKSNFLDVFRFLRDLCKPSGGGLQYAINSRGGLKKIRCLAATNVTDIEITLEIEDTIDNSNIEKWKYSLVFNNGPTGEVVLKKELVEKNNKVILNRPNISDNDDRKLLTQTFIESVLTNNGFRKLADFFSDTLYLHLIPQLLKYGDSFAYTKSDSDPFGQNFLEKLSKTQERTRNSRLKRINEIISKNIPSLGQLSFERDNVNGKPHLLMNFKHWRAHGNYQREDQFSDGTLRIIALLWTLMESNDIILLEEPELSLHDDIVRQIPKMIYDSKKSSKKSGGQIFISTHSREILENNDIVGGFVIITPISDGKNGSDIIVPSESDNKLMQHGMSPAEVLLPKTYPKGM